MPVSEDGMAARTICAIAFLLTSSAVALAAGPMTPMTLPASAPTAENTAESAAPPMPPPPIPPASAIASLKAKPATRVAKTYAANDAGLSAEAEAGFGDGAVDMTVGDAVDAVKSSRKRRPPRADASLPGVDPDHMASVLNRIQLDDGYGSAGPGPGLVPPAAGE
jgi:hypothetical protein